MKGSITLTPALSSKLNQRSLGGICIPHLPACSPGPGALAFSLSSLASHAAVCDKRGEGSSSERQAVQCGCGAALRVSERSWGLEVENGARVGAHECAKTCRGEVAWSAVSLCVRSDTHAHDLYRHHRQELFQEYSPGSGKRGPPDGQLSVALSLKIWTP